MLVIRLKILVDALMAITPLPAWKIIMITKLKMMMMIMTTGLPVAYSG